MHSSKKEKEYNMKYWSDALSTGMDDVDEQHKVLVGLLEKITDCKEGDEADVNAILIELVNYTSYHFSYEEKKMEASAYPKMADHKKEHTDLLNAVPGYLTDFQAGKLTAADLVAFLKKWVVNHIMVKDILWGNYEKSVAGK